MTLHELAFFFAAFTSIAAALAVILHPSPVYCALALVVTLFQIAVLFLLLDAQMIAFLQILVYAGAIMVLFLFVVMLLNVKGESAILTPGAAKGFGILFALLGFVELLWTVLAPAGESSGLPEAVLPPDFGSPAAIGRILYTVWLFPFEITSILLLVAVIGAVVLAKRKFA